MRDKNLEGNPKYICKNCKHIIGNGDEKCYNCGRTLSWGLLDDNYNNKKNGNTKKTSGTNKLKFWDYVSSFLMIVLCLILLGIIIQFFIFAIKELFDTSDSYEMSVNNPTNMRRVGKIIVAIIAIILFIFKKE